MAAPALVSLRAVGKTFPSGLVALADYDLDVRDGEILTLLGPSGCGKSTVLRLISGLANPTAGAINWSAPQVKNNIGVVFQDATLLPWASVFDNVFLPLRLKGVPRQAASPRIEEALAHVGLLNFSRALPRELSGGMRMRCAIARALVTRTSADHDGRTFRRPRRGDALQAQRRSSRAQTPVRRDDRLRHPFGVRSRLSLDAHRGDVAARRQNSSTTSRSTRRSRATTTIGRAGLSPTCVAGRRRRFASQSKRRRRDPEAKRDRLARHRRAARSSSRRFGAVGSARALEKHPALYSPGAERHPRQADRGPRTPVLVADW